LYDDCAGCAAITRYAVASGKVEPRQVAGNRVVNLVNAITLPKYPHRGPGEVRVLYKIGPEHTYSMG